MSTVQESDATLAQKAQIYGMGGTAGVDAAARIRDQAARIAELEAQLVTTQRDLIHARQHEKAIRLDERQKTAAAIDDAMSYGSRGINPPPGCFHWLAPYWKLGHEAAQNKKNLARAAEHRQRLANEYDETLEDLRPAMELILANREYFGAKLGERLAPTLTEFFLKAYVQAPADAPAAEKNLGGHELIQFVRGLQTIALNGTHVAVATTADEKGYMIRLTTHKGLETEYVTEFAIKDETLGVVLTLIAKLTGLWLPGVGTIEMDGSSVTIRSPHPLCFEGSLDTAPA